MITNLDHRPRSSSCWESLRSVLPQIGPHSCPWEYNFHLHTDYSDGRMSAENLLRQALQSGLKGFAITDHHTLQGYEWAQAHLPEHGPQLWTGVEITARLLGCEVHILGYEFDPDAAGMQPYLQGEAVRDLAAAEVVHKLHESGGLAILAHPFRYNRPATELVEAAVACGIDGLEAYYCYKNTDPWLPSPDQTRLSEHLADTYGLYKTCGTDSHGLSITHRI